MPPHLACHGFAGGVEAGFASEAVEAGLAGDRGALRVQAFAERDEPGAEGLAEGGEGALVALVVGAALGRLDGDGGEAEGAELVWAGAHVGLADVAGEGEAVGDQFAWREGGEFEPIRTTA